MNFVHLAAAMLALGSPNNPTPNNVSVSPNPPPATIAANQTVLLDFGADWCGYCQKMEPVVGQLAAQGYPVRKINVDKDHALAEKYNVQGLPCFILLVKGKEVDRVIGATDRSRLLAMFSRNGVGPGGGAGASRAPSLADDSPDSPSVRFPRTDQPDRSAAEMAAAVAQRHGWTDPPAAEEAVEASPERLIRASVRLRIEDRTGISCGSGTIIDARQGEALILTCGHMFREADKQSRIMVDLFGPGAPQAVPGKLIDFDLKSEVGLLSIQTDYPVSVAHIAPAGYALRKGDRVISVGCDGGADATVRETVVKSINRYGGPANVQVGFQPVQGRSGGGLFTPEGRVVGVCNAGDPQDNEGEFSHLSVVDELLDRNGLAFTYQSAGGAERQAAGGVRQAADDLMAEARRQKVETVVPAAVHQLQQVAVRDPSFAGASGECISPEDKAAIEMLREKSQGAEVICIVRPLADPKAKSEIIVLDQVSPGFLKHLADERQLQPARQLTSLEIPRTQSESPEKPVFQFDPWWADILK
jgi:thiol-disulfide isomerase/thioredoxin